MPIIKETKYLAFQWYMVKGRKTPVIDVLSRSGSTLLGRIKWYGPWRQFAFYPNSEKETIFNRECLNTINEVISELMEQRKQARQRDKFIGVGGEN